MSVHFRFEPLKTSHVLRQIGKSTSPVEIPAEKSQPPMFFLRTMPVWTEGVNFRDTTELFSGLSIWHVLVIPCPNCSGKSGPRERAVMGPFRNYPVHALWGVPMVEMCMEITVGGKNICLLERGIFPRSAFYVGVTVGASRECWSATCSQESWNWSHRNGWKWSDVVGTGYRAVRRFCVA